jgi:ketosteroid isomerase-like protein
MPAESTSYPHSKTARTPEDCNRILLAALEAGDLETSVAMYEASAVLFKKSGETMLGLDAIRQNNASLIALKPRFSIAFIKTAISGDGSIATNRMKVGLKATGADGKAIEGENYTLEVLRKQADGSWRYIIDDPYGSMRVNLRER